MCIEKLKFVDSIPGDSWGSTGILIHTRTVCHATVTYCSRVLCLL